MQGGGDTNSGLHHDSPQFRSNLLSPYPAQKPDAKI